MPNYNSAFRLDPDCGAPHEAARELAKEIGGDWKIIEDIEAGEMYLVTEEDG